jgi:cell division septum initiation protein DivIVA
MRRQDLKRIFASFIVASTVLTGCTSNSDTTKNEEKKEETVKKESTEEVEKEVDYTAVFQEAVTELNKASEGKEVDYEKVTNLYTSNLQSLVQKRDQENDDTVDQHITTALKAGKDGSMDKVIVKQIFDKLMQKVFYTTMKHEFNEITENWGKTEVVKEEIEEAKVFYSILQTTVQKRDTAYATNMVEVINGGFSEIEKAVEDDDQLAFQLGKQVVDKTMMKTFYFATGAIPNGYATKAATAAKEGSDEAKVEQAEGWAFYQSIFPYVNKHAAVESAFISSQFDLQTEVTAIDPAAVNKAFIRGFSKVALDEYKESLETWGEDKSVITGLEGALFIDVIGQDIKGLIGEESYNKLTEQAQKYIDATKAKDKAAGELILKEIEATLQSVIEKAK